MTSDLRLTFRSLANAPGYVAATVLTFGRTIVSGITPMTSVVDRATATWTLSVWMFGLFAIAAVVLVCVGLFSTVSLDATRRSREFALRIALGALPRDIVHTAVASTGAHVVAGVVVGVVLALVASRAMTGLPFGVNPLDARTYAGVVCVAAATSPLDGSCRCIGRHASIQRRRSGESDDAATPFSARRAGERMRWSA